MRSPYPEALERFLARIYVDPEARSRFLAAPQAEAEHAGLSEEQCRALQSIDLVGLKMAARSLAHKRAANRIVRQRNDWRRLVSSRGLTWWRLCWWRLCKSAFQPRRRN